MAIARRHSTTSHIGRKIFRDSHRAHSCRRTGRNSDWCGRRSGESLADVMNVHACYVGAGTGVARAGGAACDSHWLAGMLWRVLNGAIVAARCPSCVPLPGRERNLLVARLGGTLSFPRHLRKKCGSIRHCGVPTARRANYDPCADCIPPNFFFCTAPLQPPFGCPCRFAPASETSA